MPKIFSRIYLEVVSIRAEPLDLVDDDEARREGISWSEKEYKNPFMSRMGKFAALWDELHGEKNCWAKNPSVWRIELRRRV
jgi:hypothetical protein